MSEQTNAPTERDELAEVVCEALEKGPGIYDTSWHEDCAMADVILAAGYRKPRTVTTVEELNALAVGSIILDSDPDAMLKEEDGWRSLLVPDVKLKSFTISLPATVLHEGNAS